MQVNALYPACGIHQALTFLIHPCPIQDQWSTVDHGWQPHGQSPRLWGWGQAPFPIPYLRSLTAHWVYNPVVSEAPPMQDSRSGGLSPSSWGSMTPTLFPLLGPQSAQHHPVAGPPIISQGVSFLGSKLG